MKIEDLVCYKEMPIWNIHSIPTGFRQPHNTKVGTWAKLHVLRGEVEFAFVTEDGVVISTHEFSDEQQPPLIEPQVWHRIVSVSSDFECQISFYCKPVDYFVKKYQLTAVHSEVVNALPYLTVGAALDIGCGVGRNSLYLSQYGFKVDAWDNNINSLTKLNEIIQAENIHNIDVQQRDLNENPMITGSYNFICCTVVMMFLQPKTIPILIEQMQNATVSGGYHLIVCAMESDDYPLQLPFPFVFKAHELENYYQGWNIVKYNEDVGELHKTDANGNRIKQRFATLLAQKA